MKTIYLLKEIRYFYDKHIWKTEERTIKDVFDSEINAIKALTELNLTAYYGKPINQYIAALENQTEIWAELVSFFNKLDLDDSKKFHTESHYVIPKSLSIKHLQKIKDITGIEFFEVEKAEEKNKWVVSYCCALRDDTTEECHYLWLQLKEYNSLKDLEDEMIHVLINYMQNFYYDEKLDIQFLEKNAKDSDKVLLFLNSSNCFLRTHNSDGNELIRVLYNVKGERKNMGDASLEYSRMEYGDEMIKECTELLHLMKTELFIAKKI